MPQICNFPGSRVIGKPADWDDSLDGECLSIFVSDHIDTLTGHGVQYTIYKFSDDEIEALRNGGVLRLGIVGMKQHPVFNMGVFSPELTATIGIEPMGDLSPIISG